MASERTESGSLPASKRVARHRVKLVLRYDGGDFRGWQRQADVRTVQAVVEDTLASVVSERVVVHASGRTDAGVHALGQVAHFDTESRLSPETIARAMNARLPDDVAVVSAAAVAADFHARFDVWRKTYCYQLHVAKVECPFHRRFFAHVHRELDVAAMRAAARLLLGRHDFRSFAAEAHDIEDCVRTLFALRVLHIPSGLRIFATGDGFLMHMVRNVAGTLLKVGLNKIAVAEVATILAARDRRLAPPALSPAGLFLWRVEYARARQVDREAVDSGSRDP
jgi:tRNA pseudouridine38-40 synthase